MKRVFVKACVKITAYRCIKTNHISAEDGTIIKTDFRVDEDEPVIIEVHETELLGKSATNELDTASAFSSACALSTIHHAQHKSKSDVPIDCLESTIPTCPSDIDTISQKDITVIHDHVTNPVLELSSTNQNSKHVTPSTATDKCQQTDSEQALPARKRHSQNLANGKLDSECEEQRIKRNRRAKRTATNLKQKEISKDPTAFHAKLKSCKKLEHGKTTKESPTPALCKLCNTEFASENLLNLHTDKVHNGSVKSTTCSLCGHQFNSASGLATHQNGGTCNRSYKCHVCEKVFDYKSRDTYKKHLNNHKMQAEGTRFSCEKCERVYKSSDALKKHAKKHLGIKPHSCNVCGKSFALSYMVRDHMRTHTGVKPYLCNICGVGFSVSSHVTRHLKSHSKGTLNKRGRNRKDIEQSSELQKQMPSLPETHTGDRPTSLGTVAGPNITELTQPIHGQQQKSSIPCDSSDLCVDQLHAPSNADRSMTSYMTQLTSYSDQQDMRTFQEADSFYHSVYSENYQTDHGETSASGVHFAKDGISHLQTSVITQPVHPLSPSLTQMTAQVEESGIKWSSNYCNLQPAGRETSLPVMITPQSPVRSYQMPYHTETPSEHLS